MAIEIVGMLSAIVDEAANSFRTLARLSIAIVVRHLRRLTGRPMSRGCVPTISNSKRIAVGCVATIAIAAACSGTKTPNEKGQGPAVPVQTPAAGRTNGGPPAQQTEDGQWLMPAKNYASTRFSGLNQITADNVKNLKLAWT